MHVCQTEVTVCDHLQAVCIAQTQSHVWPTRVLFRHTPTCPHAFIFSVQAAEVHWQVPMKMHAVSVCSCPCVTTLVELMVFRNVFYAFFHWSVPEKKRRVLFALFI